MSSEYVFDRRPSPVRPDSAAVLINLWRTTGAERGRRFTRDLLDAVWGDELAAGELSFALFLGDDGRDLFAYKQWTSKSAYDTCLRARGLGGAEAFRAANPDVDFWHDWFAVYDCGGKPALLHVGLRGDVGLAVVPGPDDWTVHPFDAVPLPRPTRFRLLRAIERAPVSARPASR